MLHEQPFEKSGESVVGLHPPQLVTGEIWLVGGIRRENMGVGGWVEELGFRLCEKRMSVKTEQHNG